MHHQMKQLTPPASPVGGITDLSDSSSGEVVALTYSLIYTLLTLLIPDDAFCFLDYYYYDYGFSTVFLLCLYTLLVLFMGSWFAYSEVYGTV